MEVCDVAIITINYNNSDLTVESVKSFIKTTAEEIDYHIILVDNGSEGDDYKNLSQKVNDLNSDKVKLVRSDINTGFGGGNMFGVQFVNATYYAFINNDTVLHNDCLSILKSYMDAHTEVAICGPEILNEKLEKKIGFDHFVSVQREIFGSRFLELKNSKKYPSRKTQHKNPVAVNYVNGSFMFCRAIDFNFVGGFDTNIFLFFEENDLSYRLLKHNKSTHYVPEAKYIHFQGKSMPSSELTKIELKTSMFYVIRKHSGYLSYQFLRLIFILRYGLSSIVKPTYFTLFLRILIGLPISKSLKNNQKIIKL